MKKTWTLFMALLLLRFAGLAQVEADLIRYFGNADTHESGQGIVAHADGSFALAGIDRTKVGEFGNFFIAKIAPGGEVEWVNERRTPEREMLLHFAAAPDGGYLLGGWAAQGYYGTQEALLVKADSNGDEEWARSFGPGAVVSTAAAPEQGYIAAVRVADNQSRLLRLSPNGEEIWEVDLDWQVERLAVTTDGEFLLGGDNNGATLALVGSDGGLLWQNTYLTPASTFLFFRTIHVLANGHFLLVGARFGDYILTWVHSDGSIDNQVALSSLPQLPLPQLPTLNMTELPNGELVFAGPSAVFKLDSEGALLALVWYFNSPLAFIRAGSGLSLAPNGKIAIAASFENDDLGTDALAVLLNADLSLAWRAVVGEGAPQAEEAAWQCRPTLDGGFVLTGPRAFSGRKNDFYLVKTDAAGNVQWEANYGSELNERSYAVAALSDGGYLLAGQRFAPGAGIEELVLLKTGADGQQLWEKTYDYAGASLGINQLVEEWPDGRLAIFYSTSAATFGYRYMLADAQGDSLQTWAIEPSGPYRRATLSGDGSRILLTGFGGPGTLATVAEVAPGGASAASILSFDLTNSSIGYGIEEADDGGVLLLSSVRFMFDTIALVKLDAGLATVEWTRYFSPSSNRDFPFYFRPQLVKTNDGDLIIAAAALSEPDLPDNRILYFIKVDEEGNELWSRALENELFDEAFYDARPTLDGGLVLAGSARAPDRIDRDMLLLKVLSDGTVATIQPRFLGELQLSPNPSASQLELRFHSAYEGPVSIAVFNLSGQCLRRFEESKAGPLLQCSYDLNGLPTGSYAVRLTAKGQSIARIWVKNN